MDPKSISNAANKAFTSQHLATPATQPVPQPRAFGESFAEIATISGAAGTFGAGVGYGISETRQQRAYKREVGKDCTIIRAQLKKGNMTVQEGTHALLDLGLSKRETIIQLKISGRINPTVEYVIHDWNTIPILKTRKNEVIAPDSAHPRALTDLNNARVELIESTDATERIYNALPQEQQELTERPYHDFKTSVKNVDDKLYSAQCNLAGTSRNDSPTTQAIDIAQSNAEIREVNSGLNNVHFHQNQFKNSVKAVKEEASNSQSSGPTTSGFASITSSFPVQTKNPVFVMGEMVVKPQTSLPRRFSNYKPSIWLLGCSFVFIVLYSFLRSKRIQKEESELLSLLYQYKIGQLGSVETKKILLDKFKFSEINVNQILEKI